MTIRCALRKSFANCVLVKLLPTVVFEGEIRAVAVCRLKGDGYFFDADKERKPLLDVCPEARLEYFDIVAENGERIRGAYSIVLPEPYCGKCRHYACTDPCPLVY